MKARLAPAAILRDARVRGLLRMRDKDSCDARALPRQLLSVAVVRSRIRLRPGLRLDLVARRELLETLDHDLVAGLQAVGDEPDAVLHRAGAHRLHRDAVVVLDDEHLAAATAIAL